MNELLTLSSFTVIYHYTVLQVNYLDVCSVRNIKDTVPRGCEDVTAQGNTAVMESFSGITTCAVRLYVQTSDYN